MDAELKAKWVKALRSGSFVQTRGYLHRNGRYCCLGVLNCVGNGVTGEDVYKAGYSYAIRHCGEKHLMTLSSMNDRDDPFTVIADYIEANL